MVKNANEDAGGSVPTSEATPSPKNTRQKFNEPLTADEREAFLRVIRELTLRLR